MQSCAVPSNSCRSERSQRRLTGSGLTKETIAETCPTPAIPPIRRYLPRAGKSPFAGKCVVVAEVRVEPVSATKFPGNREINRVFREPSLAQRFRRPFNEQIQWLADKFPTQRNREVQMDIREHFSDEQGNYVSVHFLHACLLRLRTRSVLIGNFAGE